MKTVLRSYPQFEDEGRLNPRRDDQEREYQAKYCRKACSMLDLIGVLPCHETDGRPLHRATGRRKPQAIRSAGVRRLKKWHIRVPDFKVQVLGFGVGFPDLTAQCRIFARKVRCEAAGKEAYDGSGR